MLKKLWKKPLSSYPFPKKTGIWAARIAVALGRDLQLGQMNLRAMSMVYSTLLSIVPLLALSFAVLKGFGVHNQLEPLLLEVLAPLGEQAVTITNQILGFVSNIKVGVLGAVGLGVLVYTVVSLIHKIVAALEFTWGGRRGKGSRRLFDYLVILMTGPLLAFAVAGAVSGAVESSIVQELLRNEWLAAAYQQVIRWLPLTILTLVLTFVYWFVPDESVGLLAALVGGVIGGALWKLSGWAFASFVVGSGSYTAVYSAFATLMLFIIWLYVNWLILLVGSRISFYVQHPEMMAPGVRQRQWLPADMERVSLEVMRSVGVAFRDGVEPPTTDQLRRLLEVDVVGLEWVLDRLKGGGFVRQDTEGGYLPASPMANMKVLAILQVVREEQEAKLHLKEEFKGVSRLQLALKEAVEERWANYSLGDLLDNRGLTDEREKNPEVMQP